MIDEREYEEQCRIIGMSAERELSLRAENDRLRARVAELDVENEREIERLEIQNERLRDETAALRARVAELEGLLLEALASCQSWITDGGYEDDPDVARICDRARAAIAKAKGQVDE